MIAKFKKKYTWLASAGLMLALLLVASITVAPVAADPPTPWSTQQFYGTVTVNGGPASTGTAVSAYVDSVLNASTTVDSQGRYGYSPIFSVTGTNGQTVTFKVGTTNAPQSAIFQGGSSTRRNLSVVTTSLAVSTSAATSPGSRTATLNGNLTNMGSFSSVNVSFQYGTTPSYGQTATGTPVSLTLPGTFTAAITGLTPSTLYHCRAVATSGSTTVYGGDMSFTTTASALSVATNVATSVTASGATLNGNLTDLGANTSVQVYFQYGTTAAYGSTTTTQAKTSTGAFTATLSSLLSGTEYHFRAVAVGSTTVYGSDKTFTTPVGSLAVTTGSASAIGSTSTILNGTLTSLGGAASANVYFQYGKTISYGNTTPAQTRSSVGSFSAAISGLDPSTTYHFQAVAIGSTVYGSDASFITSSSTGGTSPPHQFYGKVYVSGALAPSGTAVAAYVNGSPAASTTTDSSGKYGYTTLFLVPGTSGGAVTFYVGGTLVSQTATYSSGGMSRLNLYSTTPTGLTVTTTTGSGTYVSSTTATLSGTLVSLGTDTSATPSIDYGPTTAYGWGTFTMSSMSSPGTFTTPAIGTGSSSPPAGGLTPDQVVHFRAKVVGSPSGNTVYGSDATYVHTPGGGTKLLGADDTTPAGYSGAGYQMLNRFQAVAFGNMTEFKVKCNSNGTISYAVYADSSGSPGTRLAQQATPQNCVAGWNTLAISTVSLTSGTYYWLAIYIATGNIGYNTSGGTRKWKSGASTFPDPFDNTGFGDDSIQLFEAGWGAP
jgi:hypothetical protein